MSAVSLLLSCGNGVLSPTELLELSAARERWREHGGPDYTVESRFSCFCHPALTTWTRLTVRNGAVVAAEPLSSFPFEVGSVSMEAWYTVTELHDAIASATGSDYLRDAKVTYDQSLGYPLDFSTTCKPDILDCGSLIQMRNLALSP